MGSDGGAARRWGTGLAALAIGAAVGLGLAEVMVRWVAPQEMRLLGEGVGLHRYDPRYGFVLLPNSHFEYLNNTVVDTNSRGFRDRDYGPKEPNEIRILSIGDSYAFGAGVTLAESYSKVLERRLAARFPEARVSVVIAAVSGWGTNQMTMAFEDLYREVGADLVIVSFVAANDVQDNSMFEGQRGQRVFTPLGFLGQHLHTVRLFRRVTWPIARFVANRFPPHVDHTIELLRRLEQEIADAGLPSLFLVIPARHQVRPGVHPAARLVDRLGLGWIAVYQNDRVIAHFREDGVRYVDLLPPLAAHDPIEPVVFDNDTHNNAAGHRLIADEIESAIEAPMTALVEARRSVVAADGEPRVRPGLPEPVELDGVVGAHAAPLGVRNVAE